MKLIGAGWGRTGTSSLEQALTTLGLGPVCHMRRMFDHPDEAGQWAAWRRGDAVDLPALLDTYGAGVDWPACWAWKEAAELYPDAPVLLSVRDSADWYASVRGSIHRWADPSRPNQDESMRPAPEAAELLSLIWSSEFGSWEAVHDEAATIAAYERHVADVRASCPPERLVEWTATDGWEPICAALGVPVPAEPFPHVNRRADRPGANDPTP